MQQQCNIDKLVAGCQALGISLSGGQQSGMLRHLELLGKWNRRINLTSIHDPGEGITQHLLDSLAVMPFISGVSVLDIGTGAGFPGLPLAIADSSLEVTLLDSRGKRIEFLRHVVAETGIKNAIPVHSRIETLRTDRQHDTLISRAFSSLGDFIHLTGHLQREGTRLVAMKGKFPEAELGELPAPLAERVNVHRIQVPGLDAERHAVVLDI